ncbi:MAG: hypothetical protein HY606_01145 [Planctomycetes bacterium]|nr:hypothetical protein [Planctomycetota bacterium]
MTKIIIRLLLVPLFFLSFSIVSNSQSSSLKLNLIITKVELSTNGTNFTTLFENSDGVTFDLLSNTLADGSTLTQSALADGIYTHMNIYATHFDFVENGVTQHYEDTLTATGISINPFKFSSNPDQVLAGTHLPMQPFNSSGATSFALNVHVPSNSISGNTIGSYGLTQPPVVSPAVSGSGVSSSGQVGTLNLTVNNTVGGKTLTICLFKTTDFDVPPLLCKAFTSTATTTTVSLSDLPLGTVFVGGFEDVDPNDQSISQGPNFQVDRIGMFGISETSPQPTPVSFTASSPTVTGSMKIVTFSEMKSSYGEGARVMEEPCTTPGTATISGRIKYSVSSVAIPSGARVFIGAFKISDQNKVITCGNSGGTTTTFLSCWNSSLTATYPTSLDQFGTMAESIFTENTSSGGCSFFMTYIPVPSGVTSFDLPFQIKGLLAGTYFVACFVDLNGDQDPGPSSDERIGRKASFFTVTNNQWLDIGTIEFTSSNTATSFQFMQGGPPQ